MLNRARKTKQSATDALKTTSRNAVQKTAEATGDLIGNKIANRITKVSGSSPQNNSETERYISPKKDRKLLMV